MSEYIPYSIRHDITDKDLAGLLDFLERVMGWEIQINEKNLSTLISDKDSGINIIIRFFEWESRVYIKSLHDGIIIDKMKYEVFFRTYKTLLPVIRDLYSKN